MPILAISKFSLFKCGGILSLILAFPSNKYPPQHITNSQVLYRRNYENLNYTGDFNEFVYVNAFFSRGVICLISAASYHELTTIIPQSVDIAIYKKDNVRILPEWPNVNIYYYSEKRHKVGIKKINVGNDFFYIYVGAALQDFCLQSFEQCG